MSILEIAIQAEGGVGKLAEALDIAQNVISNWRKRGVPKPWAQVLQLRYSYGPIAEPGHPKQPAEQGATQCS